jgi:hypothetical protein
MVVRGRSVKNAGPGTDKGHGAPAWVGFLEKHRRQHERSFRIMKSRTLAASGKGRIVTMMEARDIATWVYLGPERRRVERKVFRGSAHLLLPSRELVQVRTIDISPGGIGLVAPSNLPADIVCEVRFRAPLQGERLEMLLARGRIAYSILSGKENGFLVGFQFTDIPAPALALIKRYVGPSA